MTDKHDKIQFIKNKITTNDAWAVRALMRIYDNQTSEEQNESQTKNDNGIGFCAIDANFLSGVAQFYKKNGFLSAKQKAVLKKKIGKYASQLYMVSDQSKLEQTMSKADAPF